MSGLLWSAIEDAAQAFGASYRGRPAGSFGIGCFSFFATKTITAGEGGFVSTSDEDLAERVRRFIGHGIERDSDAPWRRDCLEPGMNFRMSNLAAAVGVAQIERLGDFVLARRSIAARYNSRLADVPGVGLPFELPENSHCFQMYTIRVAAERRDGLVRWLRNCGIEASVHFDPPVHRQSWYRRSSAGPDLPVTDRLASCIVSLPIFPAMTDAEIDDVCGSVIHYMDRTAVSGAPERES